jgi:hypothetical protein
MNPVLAEILKWIVAGVLIFTGTWIFYIVVKARNTDFKVQVARAGKETSKNYSRSKPLLLIVAVIVIVLIWLMKQDGFE